MKVGDWVIFRSLQKPDDSCRKFRDFFRGGQVPEPLLRNPLGEFNRASRTPDRGKIFPNPLTRIHKYV